MKFFGKGYNWLYHRGFRGFLGLLEASTDWKVLPVHLTSQSRVLIFSAAGIGDTLTDSVVFKALQESYPGIELAAVCHVRRQALLRHNPFVAKVFCYAKGIPAFFRLYLELKAAGPWDAILHLRGNDPEPRALSFLLNPGVTFSVPNMTRLQELCGHGVEQPDWDETHGVEQTLRIAYAVGATTKEPHLVFELSPEEEVASENFLRSQGLSGRPRLVLQVGGGRRAHWRDWPIENYAKVLEYFQNAPLDLVVLGGKDHRDRSRVLARLLDGKGIRYFDLVGKTSLVQSAWLLKSSKAVVSTDTGMMHLSFAVGARVVALIHCNNPARRVGPYGYGDRHRVIELIRPAHYAKPSDISMNQITPDHVIEKLKELGL
ncbi:MAG: glycosyltransferase family 9 protein [Verrucomicrobiota bacterium]